MSSNPNRSVDILDGPKVGQPLLVTAEIIEAGEAILFGDYPEYARCLYDISSNGSGGWNATFNQFLT